MKTKLFSIIVTVLFSIALIINIVSTVSCSVEDEPAEPAVGTVTFTYTIPDKLFKYLEIEACRTGTDMMHEPMLDSVYVAKYNVSKIPNMLPTVFVFRRTNRPLPDKLTECYLDMEIETNIQVGNKTISEVYVNRYYIDDVNVADAIETLMKDQRNSTYAVKFSRDGEVEYIAPKQRPITM